MLFLLCFCSLTLKCAQILFMPLEFCFDTHFPLFIFIDGTGAIIGSAIIGKDFISALSIEKGHFFLLYLYLSVRMSFSLLPPCLSLFLSHTLFLFLCLCVYVSVVCYSAVISISVSNFSPSFTTLYPCSIHIH